MEGSLSAAVSGIDANQAYLDVIGNNIANANTVGYKEEQIQFTDLLGNMVSAGGAPNASSGGVNPQVFGAGVTTSPLTTNFAQGSDEVTGRNTDIEINGDGFLMVRKGGQQYYTRNGNLSWDAEGHLVSSTGALVLGWTAQNGSVSTGSPVGPITVAPGELSSPMATGTVTIGGNLDPTATSPQTLTATAYDSSGKKVPLQVVFTPPAAAGDPWTMQVYANGSNQGLFNSPESIAFDSNGEVATINGAAPTTTDVNGSSVYALQADTSIAGVGKLTFDLAAAGGSNALTSVSGDETAAISSIDGYGAGWLQNVSIGSDGTVTGTFSNGQSQVLAQVAVASFANDNGLVAQGNALYTVGPNSGQPQVGIAGNGGRGTLVSGHLEGSNVDLGDQLTALIVAQSSYEANTKVVSTSAAVLQALNQMT